MEKYSRESIYAELKKYCTFSDDGYFIEVTKWTNGEGYDINIASHLGTRVIQVTIGEFELIKKLIKKLDK